MSFVLRKDKVQVRISKETPPLLSFRQGLAAWDDTPDSIVSLLINCVPVEFAALLDWPGLTQPNVHSAVEAEIIE